MSQEIKTERNYGIDLLRMLSMFMVCILHILEQGGVIGASKDFSAQYEAAWFLDIAAFCAVNVFALISGYVCIDAKYKYSNGIMLYLKVIFYALLVTAVFAFVKPKAVGAGEWVKAIFPVMTYQYWYFSCYVVLFFLIPLLNMGINSLSKKQLKVVVIALIALFSVLQTGFKHVLLDAFWQDECGEIFNTAEGYSPIWIIVLYIIGAGLKKTGFFEKVSVKKALAGFIIAALITWGFKYIIECRALKVLNGEKRWEMMQLSNRLANYISPTIVFEAIFLLALFDKIRLPEFLKKVVKVASPAAFSVYLIHVHQLVWIHVITDRFAFLAKYSAPVLALGVLGCALGIYTVCSIIDIIRALLFKALKLKALVSRIDTPQLAAE